jgi:hypothetical protein
MIVKPDHADEEQPLAAERVTEPAAGDQDQGVGQRVPGQRPLHVGVAGMEVPLDGRDGDVHDRDIEQVHERG